MRPRRNSCACSRPVEYAAFMRLAVQSPQEHPRLGADRLGQDDLDQGADPGDSAR